ncbi:MAG: GNAT family N-acetyltransferase [Dehalococcoidia bacterium]
MTTFSTRPLDLQALIGFATKATSARMPGLTYWNPGDIAWQLGMLPASMDGSGFVRSWANPSGEVVALAVFEPPLNFQFDVLPGFPGGEELAEKATGWAEERWLASRDTSGEIPKAYEMLGANTLSTTALESDIARIAMLERLGYERVDRHCVRYRRSLAAEVQPLPLPDGLHFAHATEGRLDERVDVHRDAWSVWGPSSFSASRYRRLRTTPIYDETLDLVVEDATGRMLSCCICWFDVANGIGHFEPVGTRPEFAGKGLGRALVTEGLRRLRERGAHTALIGTASVNAAALRTYTACGFDFVEREDFYSKVTA